MRFLPLAILALVLAIFFFASRSTPAAGILVSLGVAWASWPLAAFGVPRVAGAGRRDFPARASLAWAGLFPSLILATAALVLLMAEHAPWWPAPVAGAALASIVYFAASRLWFAPLRPIFALRAVLGDRERAREAAESLARSFEASPPRSGMGLRRYANRAIAAAAVLCEARCWSGARRVLATLRPESLDSTRRASVQALSAVLLVYARDRNGAWNALKDAFAHARDPQLLTALTLTDALLTALDGHAEDAERRLAEVGEPEDLRLRRAWLIAKAHAEAARAETAAARATLTRLAELAPDGLARVVELAGPASDLARSLSAERPS